jgi:Ras-related protein Rap-1B
MVPSDYTQTSTHTLYRELYMKTGQGFLLVFSITSQSSLNELSDLREQIIRIKDDENVPIVIVGNKSDLDQDRMVSRQEAFKVSQNWGNAPYYETSARRRGESSYSLLDDVNLPSSPRYWSTQQKGAIASLQTQYGVEWY